MASSVVRSATSASNSAGALRTDFRVWTPMAIAEMAWAMAMALAVAERGSMISTQMVRRVDGYLEMCEGLAMDVGVERYLRSDVHRRLQRWKMPWDEPLNSATADLQFTWSSDVIEALGELAWLVISNQNEGTTWRKQQPGILYWANQWLVLHLAHQKALLGNTNHRRNE